MARPTKLNEDLHERITQYVRAGLFLKDAAALSEVAESTVYLWIERGQIEESRVESGEPPDEDEQKYLEFSEAIERARAYANALDMNAVSQAAQNDPRWALERMKLRNPRWFRQEVGLEIKRPSAEELADRRRAEKLRKATNEIRGGVYR